MRAGLQQGTWVQGDGGSSSRRHQGIHWRILNLPSVPDAKSKSHSLSGLSNLFGDDSTKLELRVPDMPNSHERGLRVADDPVAASDYFHFHIPAVFRFLFGWDMASRESSAQVPAAVSIVDGPSTPTDDADPSVDDLYEQDTGHLPLSVHGKAHQVDDYLHRGPTLSHLSFYDFVRFCKIWKAPAKANKGYHPLKESHPNVGVYCHRYDPGKPLGVPRAIFSSNPRSNGTTTHGDTYCAAMLAQFIPFDIDAPLKTTDTTYEDAFQNASFSADALRIMDNWAALSECDDARDAEQLLRRKREACRDHSNDRAAAAIAEGCAVGGDSATADIDMELLLNNPAKKDSSETLALMATMAASHWFGPSVPAPTASSVPSERSDVLLGFTAPAFTTARRRQWIKQMADVEGHLKSVAAAPRASTGVLADSLGFRQAAPPETLDSEEFVGPSGPIPALPTTVSVVQQLLLHELIDALIAERSLTPSQALAFKIAARHFYQEMSESLRLFMHGEAGTGKTVVVGLLRELLERYGKAKEIMFMAPTGKAACAIGGTTQHAAFALNV
ncbi:hypothetical protein A4X13_0g5047 [Tilletia indica]|uniref:ATP-dependent DNA helicase n=1 Tax=Tilletia indica TaxID=43049 RepID=A0A8T8SVB8_9BASI|nr:hypothetical protein A4X13_0g5047 [Tilletia indica]